MTPPTPPPHDPHNPHNLTCRQLFDFLADYVDSTLPAPQRDEFERHLRACPSCVAYVDGYRRTIALGRASCCGEGGDNAAAKAPPGLLDAVTEALRKQRGT